MLPYTAKSDFFDVFQKKLKSNLEIHRIVYALKPVLMLSKKNTKNSDTTGHRTNGHLVV